MFRFSENVYCDVRIEREFKTKIIYNDGDLQQNNEEEYNCAFIRLYDGARWFYSSITDEEKIQEEIDRLTVLAEGREVTPGDPAIKNLHTSVYNNMRYEACAVKNISNEYKDSYLKKYFSIFGGYKQVSSWTARYIDRYNIKEFYSSKGSSVKYDNNVTGISFKFILKEGEEVFTNSWQKLINPLGEMEEYKTALRESIEEGINFVKNAKPIEPGEYVVVLAPVVAGVFAHESFGHKSEADSMIGDENMKKEWELGKKVGSDILSIVDYGDIEGSGYTPVDDEGNKACKTYLIKDGVLSGRLHDSMTASILEEDPTGNGRAVNFEFEPIPRMTNTYIEPGDRTVEELIGEVKDGIFIKDFNHGSGMSTFTIAPAMSYRIRDGKIAEPLKIAVASGSVFETLNLIDGLSNELELLSFITGGCGKMEQFPLPVGFGGPYVRVKKLFVQ